MANTGIHLRTYANLDVGGMVTALQMSSEFEHYLEQKLMKPSLRPLGTPLGSLVFGQKAIPWVVSEGIIPTQEREDQSEKEIEVSFVPPHKITSSAFFSISSIPVIVSFRQREPLPFLR